VLSSSTYVKAAAIRKGHTDERAAGFRDMGTFRCDGCGELFSIVHNPLLADRSVAERQAHWLEKVLAEEHAREQKHPDLIELP
jgi:hypothetical protein